MIILTLQSCCHLKHGTFFLLLNVDRTTAWMKYINVAGGGGGGGTMQINLLKVVCLGMMRI